MMGFITGIDYGKKCEVCGKQIVVTMTGNSAPYDTFICKSCGWRGIVCQSCAKKGCPKCKGTIQSEQQSTGMMY